MQITKNQIGGILVGFLLLTWLSGATGLFAFIKYRKGFDAIQFSDVAFPWNWNELRPKWGDYFIEKGIAHRDAGQWDKAFYFIRVGVSKSPTNSEGRLALADLFFQANDVSQAVNVLEAGLEYASQDVGFWTKMVNFLQYYQADREIIRILKRGLDEKLVPEEQVEAAQAALAKANYHQARFEEALEIVNQSNSISNQLTRCQIYWEQGFESLAIQTLVGLNEMFPNQREIVPLLTRFYQESGETEKALQLAKFTYLNNPYSIGASVNYFRVMGRENLAEIDRFMARVPEIYENQDALFLLANYLAEAGLYEKLEEVCDNSKPDFKNAAMVWFLRVESRVNGGAFGKASGMLTTPPDSINQLIPLHRILFQSLSMAADYGQGANDKGRLSMQQLFSSGHIRPATLLRLARKLIELNQPDEADRVLQYLLKQNPGNHAALVEKIRISLMTGNTDVAISQSKDMVEKKSMPFVLKKELLSALSSDRELFHQEATTLITQVLDTMTPTKKRLLLEIL